MQCNHFLPLLLYAVFLSKTFGAQTVFSAARMRSISAPAAMKNVPGNNRLKCAEDCTLRSECFGFSWLQGLCRFFNMSAFYDDAWQGSNVKIDVYTLNTTRLNFVACNQSSVFQGGVCERAFDGNKNQDFWGGLTCVHTFNDVPGWWQGQLSKAAHISHVTIYNRGNCCSDRLNKMSLQLDGVECHRVDLTVAFSVATFSCNAFGSSFEIYNLQSHAIILCEVEIYGL